MKQRLPAKRTTGWTSNLLAAAGDVLVPLLFAFGVGSIFSLICGCNPFTLYSYIIKKAFFSVGGLLNTLGYTTPIIITALFYSGNPAVSAQPSTSFSSASSASTCASVVAHEVTKRTAWCVSSTRVFV